MSEEKKKEKEEDPRLEIVRTYVLKSHRLKLERWQKLIGNDDYRKPIMSWLNHDSVLRLIITNNGGMLAALNNFPGSWKQKLCYFVKKSETELTVQNIKQSILIGDMSPRPVEDLSILVDEVFYPLLTNEQNQKGWPEVVKKDVEYQLQELRNTIFEVKGNIISHTLLSMPIIIDKVMQITDDEITNTDIIDVKMKNALEGIVIKWAYQIDEVLKEDSVMLFANNNHPSPFDELKFWDGRLSNLENIYGQLRDPRTRKVGQILESIESVYFTSFSQTFKLVVKSVHEARDVTLWLKPLVKYFDDFETQEFLDLKDIIAPMLHCICLVWANSTVYYKNSRMVILFKMIHNLIISSASRTLDPEAIFQGEPYEVLVKLERIMEILEYYKEQYLDFKQRLKEFQLPTTVPIYWTFRPQDIFERFDQFIVRLNQVKEILVTADDFMKLERVEIGGLKGRVISRKIQEVFDEFRDKVYKMWKEIKFDPLDPDPKAKGFDRQKHSFQEQSDVLELRLAVQFRQAFEDCCNLEQSMKLIHILGTLLNRPLITKQVGEKVFNIMHLFDDDLNVTKACFDHGVQQYEDNGLIGLPKDEGFPQVSGALMWIQKLRGRVLKPAHDIDYLEYPIFENDEGRYIIEKKDQILECLDAFEKRIFDKWCDDAPGEIDAGLKENLLKRDPDTKFLSLNFVRALKDNLNEAKCLQNMGKENLPAKVLHIFSLSDEFWDASLKLARIVEWYNEIRSDAKSEEFDILQKEIDEIDSQLEQALSKQTWENYTKDYILQMYDVVKDINRRFCRSQKNLKSMQEKIRSFGQAPLYERKDGKVDTLINLEDEEQRLERRNKNCAEAQELIKHVMKENFRLLFNLPLPETEEAEKVEEITELEVEEQEPNTVEVEGVLVDRGSQVGTSLMEMIPKIISDELIKTPAQNELYLPYEKYVDGLVASELMESIQVSIRYIKYEMDSYVVPKAPIFESKLDLYRYEEMIFRPALDLSYTGSLVEIIQNMIFFIYNMADEFERVYKPEEPTEEQQQTYFTILLEQQDLHNMKQDIISNVRKTCRAVIEHYRRYQEKFGYLWQDDKELFLTRFLKYGRALTIDEIESLDNPECTLKEEREITLVMFRNQIDYFYKVQDEVYELEKSHIFNNWLTINTKPFIAALSNVIGHWKLKFKDYLKTQVIEKLNNLEQFIEDSNEVFLLKPDQEDYPTLLKILEVLNKIKNTEIEVDNMFEPLYEYVQLLADYNVEFKQNVLDQFAELPELWLRLKKRALQVKQEIAPIQNYQVDLIRKRITLFDFRLKIYREKFRKLPFFSVPCTNAYDILDKVHLELEDKKAQYESLLNSAKLFELGQPEERDLEACERELALLKQIWDFVYTVESCIEDWKKTPWKKVNVEDLEQECKKFGKELRQLDKEIRQWDPYIYVSDLLTNLMSSLKAITALQNPAIRDRHWNELMKTTQVRFNMDDKTTLSDLVNLNLHKYEEQVKNIVDKSVKEEAMEKAIKTLAATWKNVDFEFDTHDRTRLKLLKLPEEVVETLEENLNQLQGLLASKYIAYFFNEIQQWQDKLSNADQVWSSFFEVQRKWMYLESIFIGSEDIRKQLPIESEKFDSIDREFKSILNQMVQDKNMIKATNKSGLYERLEAMQKQLIQCEKALNDYLETKRLTYSRFYFVSAADLLDILSNGNQPELVAKHLTKLYDSLAKLRFTASGSKMAKGMISKENEEYVAFKGNCDCSGKVEIWLNRVTDIMRVSLHALFEASVKAYVEKDRDAWLFDWPAQPALCATQIWWTIEVNLAFDKMEEGYDKAMKEYLDKHIRQLKALIMLLLGELTPGDRQKIMTICTIDVHARDVVAKMIEQKVETSSAFQWQSQLRHRWDDKLNNCFANICDAQFKYDYEYLGNTPRLVITPLTDRCYITLTQSLHLIMGGAPAGPAGTGKTETTKDLGRALGIMVYVFNCSEQMDYKSCGNIYKGLSQTGAWGCFDEFNRISVEVLSVVAVQVKSIQDAIKTKKTTFNFMGETIALIPTVGIFITMNPGYAGRTELPENLKALFRPCAMVVPDFELICEIMLVAEGFQEARMLARKFITLYTLCKELLSKQDHYDWGLRAIKSVLVVAGSLKRADKPDTPEEHVLMRALRDFNIPKIVTDDVPVFLGLIGDLFPNIEARRQPDVDFEKLIAKSAAEMKLQQDKQFILKVVQLEELFAVRHSVFIIGIAGTGKTHVWKTLFRTYQNQKRKPHYNDLNPKAVTNDELFGIINPATREWKDGLFSVIMRDQAELGGNGPKWIVLDGDIDPMWIESLNTVMDDNKVLTLASNERIALTKEMRLLFEISNLRTATPATVSRAGILYINPQDLGWQPYVNSWVEQRESKAEKAQIIALVDKYMYRVVEANNKFKRITPISQIAQFQMMAYLLECSLTPENVPTGCPKEWYELYFVFCVIWGFGSALFQDQLIDWRNEFHKWWINEFKYVIFPPTGTVFHYYIDRETKQWMPWSNLVPGYNLDPEIPLQSALVPTAETARLRWFLDQLIEKKHPVMLVGGAGSGKSVIVADKLNSVPDVSYAVTNVPFNFYTTSELLQKILEKPLEKKAGRVYGPPKNKFMLYFVDDINMPEVDQYGTVQPHTLIRQFMDYRHWYDRTKLSLKDIHNCQFVACMNPTAGSFTINPRLQRHFCAFAVSFPTGEPLNHIYQSIISQHLSNPAPPLRPFSNSAQKQCEALVQTALTLHQKVAQNFLPTATKFHYIFNLRDLSNIFQGMLFAGGDTVPDGNGLARLWVHEATRVYSDKLTEKNDTDAFKKLLQDVVKKGMEEIDENKVFTEPLIYWHYSEGLADSKYMPVRDTDLLNRLMDEAQENFNNMVGDMNLVLFEDAVQHICRINRILEAPRGNALLIGVGGSGKQSLSRLAAFISGLEVFQIQLRKGYVISDLKTDIAGVYMKAGAKNVPYMFLMTDAQVKEENFLVLINDMLSTGEISELFPDEDVENVVNAVRNEVKQLGIMDTRENCWKYFIEKVRRNLKIVLCFSPVGSTLRIRARKFPAIVNCTAIDWFHEWPQNALESVSESFLKQLEVLPEELTNSISIYMAYVHGTVNHMSKVYLQNERRYNYTTPKSFLELIALYSKLLRETDRDLKAKVIRLENGLKKLFACGQQVEGLKEQLAEQEVIVTEKNEAAEKLMAKVMVEREKVNAEKSIATEEEKAVRVIEVEVTVKATDCEKDLEAAQPIIQQAVAALDTIDKKDIGEMKGIAQPTAIVHMINEAVLIYMDKKSIVPRDRSWKACQAMLAQDGFVDMLKSFERKKIHPQKAKEVKKLLEHPDFNRNKAKTASAALAGLCDWVKNIDAFYNIYLDVKPKEDALEQARQELQEAQDKLSRIVAKVKELEVLCDVMEAQFQEAKSEKDACQAIADKTDFTIKLANRLVTGLESEGIRWRESIAQLSKQQTTLPGDVLLVCCFLSYVGCFTRRYRIELQEKMWIPTFKKTKPAIPYNDQIDPLTLIADEATIASWNNEGLPSDRMSSENATILINSSRWPLMIDPQLQGVKWIKQKYGKDLIVLRTFGRYIDEIEKAVSRGDTLLLENIGESLDAVLDPLLGRQLVKRGTVLKIGDREVDYNPQFRLILQTKLANPHYKPEMQAQTTLVNFTVTRDGLEDQLLAEVVKVERPDLEQQRSDLTVQQNRFKILLKELEDNLLSRLSSAGENVLEDVELVESLEKTKSTAASVSIQVEEARRTAIEIDAARENYRPTAERASILYFILNDLYKINPIYQFSLKAFTVVFKQAILSTPATPTLAERVTNLIENITFAVYMYTSRALFEKDKLILMAQIAIQVLLQSKEIHPVELDFLLRFPYTPNLTSPFDFLTNNGWGGIKALSQMDNFRGLDKDIEGSSKRWRKFVEGETPERDKFPGEWKGKTALQRLCIMRCLRPDRMTYAVRTFVEEKLGKTYVEARTVEFSKSFDESSKTTPMFFILSPGVDPLKDVEAVGKKLKFSTDHNNFYNVSLGQGQEEVAENAIEKASREGHWVILQNVHLVAKWLPTLEKKMEAAVEGANDAYRLFISAEPAPSAEYHIIPQGILESAIKITNEPPSGMKANVHKALDNFDQDTLEMCSKETEFKAILFALCYFHAVVAERRKFGPQGWNRSYPFNVGDLTISVMVLYNYLESNNKIPWEDLRYLFGEIMYGGHITDDWDRRLCRTYLEEFMQPDLVDGDLFFCPGFKAPGNLDYNGYHQYIEEELPPESPTLFYLHSNAEIGFLTTLSEEMFRTIFELQPRDAGSGGGGAISSREDVVKGLIEDFLDKIPEEFNIGDLNAKVEEKSPFIIVAIQEADRMNILMREVRRSLRELNLGLKGELTITPDMELLDEYLFFDRVPDSWTKRAYPSMLGLQSWFADLQLRLRELEQWTADFQLPSAVWLAGFFNPQSFLTAIMQETARKRGFALDNMRLSCDVTRKWKEDITAAPREGANVCGLFMEGARWDIDNGTIASSRLKELFPQMPVIFIKAITQDKVETKNIYNCPVYRTRTRGPTYVWTFDLKTKLKPSKWTLGGVCLLLQV